MTRLSIGHLHARLTISGVAPARATNSASGLSIEDPQTRSNLHIDTGSNLTGQHPCDKSRRSTVGLGDWTYSYPAATFTREMARLSFSGAARAAPVGLGAPRQQTPLPCPPRIL